MDADDDDALRSLFTTHTQTLFWLRSHGRCHRRGKTTCKFSLFDATAWYFVPASSQTQTSPQVAFFPVMWLLVSQPTATATRDCFSSSQRADFPLCCHLLKSHSLSSPPRRDISLVVHQQVVFGDRYPDGGGCSATISSGSPRRISTLACILFATFKQQLRTHKPGRELGRCRGGRAAS